MAIERYGFVAGKPKFDYAWRLLEVVLSVYFHFKTSQHLAHNK